MLASAATASVGNGRHKIQTADPAVAKQILAQDGKLVADYGAYQLYEVVGPLPELTGHQTTETRDEYDLIYLHAGTIDTSQASVRAARKAVGVFLGKRLHLVQFVGPVQSAWHTELGKAGVRVVSYIPHNTYLVYGDAASLARLQTLAGTAACIQWDGAYLDDYRIHPSARAVDTNGNARAIGTDEFAIQLVNDPDANAATLQLIDRLKLAPISRQAPRLNFLNVVVRLAPASVATLATRPELVSIQPHFPRRKLCERQDQIIASNLSGNVPSGPGYLAWLAGKGFTQAQFDASGFVVDVSDSGIDDGTTSPNHFGLYTSGALAGASRVVYNRLEGTPNPSSTLQGCDGHGNLNAHIIGGYDNRSGFPFADSSGYHYGLGVCPFVKLGSSVVFDSDTYTNPNNTDLQSRAYRDGARISNNSWGSSGPSAYDVDAQEFDALVRDAQPANAAVPVTGNQEMVVVFVAGNDGPTSGTVISPGTAKNVITVGASEGVQAFGGADGSGVIDADANSANDIIDFSSRGPCPDGRSKPDLVAPGTHISGGVPQAASPGATGKALACYTGDGISGGVGTNLFFPAGQLFYTASSGTSHSGPAVAGACALLRQYFLNNFTKVPSPAMTKAYLMNSARYLTGAYANDTLWSASQGMGGLNLGMALDATPRILRDEVPVDLFAASGQARVFTGTIANASAPLRVTVAWTDAPGSTAGNAYNNDLDLTVTVGGNTYKGNVFSGAYSTTGGTADAKDNVESVFLPAGTTGTFVVTVTAANINSDGVPNNATALDQDFALVVYNGVLGSPQLGVSPAGYDFGTLVAGTSTQTSFVVTNVGTGVLSGTSAVGSPFAIVAGSPFTVPELGATNVIVSFAPSSAGSFTGSVVFTSNGGGAANPVTGAATTPITYTITTTAVPASGGSVAGDGTVAKGSNVTVSATPNSCYTFVDWTEGRTVVSTSASYTFTATADRSLVADFAPITYTVTVSSAGGGTASGGGTVNCGTNVTVVATPDLGHYFLDWTEDGTVVSRSASYTFAANGNRVFVADFTTVPMIVTSSPLPSGMEGVAYGAALQVSGGVPPYTWSLTSGSLPAGLACESNGTIRGIPHAAGTNSFGVRVTDVNSQSATQDFALVVIAPVSIFGPLQGTYNGLIIQTNVPTHASSGAIQFVLSKTGSFIAKLRLGGVRSTFKGRFDAVGAATNTVARKDLNSLQVILRLDVSQGTGQITGTVSDGGFTAELLADRAAFGRTNPCPWNGRYTFLLVPADEKDPSVPQAHGYGSVVVTTKGAGKLAGVLGDGTKFKASVPVSEHGTCPLYSVLYVNQGSCIGWVSFGMSNTLSAVVDWFKPALASSAYYPTGFTTTVTLEGAEYISPSLGGPSVAGNWQLTLRDGDLPSNIVKNATVTASGVATITPAGDDELTLHIVPAMGSFLGSFVHPVNNRATQFEGLLLQQPYGAGAGCFQGTNTSGGVELRSVP